MHGTTRTIRGVVAGIALASAAAAGTGDCNGDGSVAVNEIIIAVRISLGEAAIDACPAADGDGDGRVSIAELVGAVRAALAERPAHERAFVLTSNFTAGSFATVELDEPRAVTPSSAQRSVHRDAVVRARHGLVYVVNRLFGDNLQVLDPNDGFRTVLQCSTGNATNPHDIAFAGDDKAYITLYGEPHLLVVNPKARPDCGDFVLGTIDLGSLADADGVPDMDQMVVVGKRLYVSLQRLDVGIILRPPAGPAALAVIDVETDTLVDSIELVGANPFASTRGLTVRGGKLYVANAGVITEIDGGIERIDLARGESEGIVVGEDDLGGDITDFVIVDHDLAYAIVSRSDFTTALLSFDPTSGATIDILLESDGFHLADIELNDRGELFVADRTRQHDGLHVFRAADGARLTGEPIDLGLAPFAIVFLP